MTATQTRYRKTRDGGPTGARFSTIAAKYPGKCRRCGGAIEVGSAIRWAPKMGTWHLKDQCGDPTEEVALAAELDAARAGLSTFLDGNGRELPVSQVARDMAYEDLTGASAGEVF